MKEIGNALSKHNVPLILSQLSTVGLIYIFQKTGFEFDFKAVQ